MSSPVPNNSSRQWWIRAASLLWLGVLAWALYALHREWKDIHFADFSAALARIGTAHLMLVLLFTVLSYWCNSLMGLLGQRWLGQATGGFWKGLAQNFIVGAFTMNAGGSVLGGGSLRLRFAAENGVTPSEAGKATAFSAIAGWAGHILLSGILLTFSAPALRWLPGPITRVTGVLLTAVGVALPFSGLVFQKAWPRPKLAWLTMAVSVVDWLFAGLAMWALFPDALPISALSLVAVVVVSQALAAFAHVPGGVGIIELALTKALGGLIAGPLLVGALICYRLFYYLVPFALGMALLAVREARRSVVLVKTGTLALRGWHVLAPRLVAWVTMAGGFLLLLSASIPIASSRRGIMEIIPVPFVEASHFISSIAGALLIVLGRNLQRRVESAWWLAVLTMSGGLAFALFKGFDWDEAVILGVMLVCLLSARSHFHRHSSLWTHRFTLSWWLLLYALLGVAIWVGFFAARHVTYQPELWWQFTLEGDASRFLRGMVGASCVFLILGLAQALRPTRPSQLLPPPPLATITKLVQTSSHADAALALLGDKSFFLTEDQACGLMYADHGHSRIVMGDPLGQSEEADDLLWDFVEQAQDEGMRAVFYQISATEMPRLVDMGFRLFKLGEEATVDLPKFSLEGPKASRLRQAINKFRRLGLKFSIWPRARVAEKIATLAAISNDWLSTQGGGEKGFSVGKFAEDYISQCSCAIISNPEGEVLAFANIWQTTGHEQLSIDLMRHSSQAPGGVMDALFIELMLWGRDQGFQEFNLGMAPLSGLSTHPLAPLWQRLAALLFRQESSFYNFTGLRAWKAKFHPHWEPRYIAVPSAWSLPVALLDATTLIGGGLRGTLTNR